LLFANAEPPKSCDSQPGPTRAPTHRERSGRVARRRPVPPAIQRPALVPHDSRKAPISERLRVRLPLDLEHVERQEHDLADADQRAGGRVRHRLAVLRAEYVDELLLEAAVQRIVDEGLPAKLVCLISLARRTPTHISFAGFLHSSALTAPGQHAL